MNRPKRIYCGPSRRQVLGAAAAAVAIVPRHVLGGPNYVAPSEKVNIAIIGAGGQGRTNARALFNEGDAQVIAIADPAEEWNLEPYYYKGVAGRMNVKAEVEKHYSEKTPSYKCADYVDFRDMLEKEKEIDAVLIATPDHLHAYCTIMAMKMGKHVYCEKPLTHNVWEARQVAKVARETGVATQMGNQGHSNEGIRQTCEWIWDGAIGQVREVHAWSDAGRWANHPGRPKETPEPPKGLNWDLWLGPRQERPYSPEYAPFNWRGWWAFGGGAIADMAPHNIDAAVWALKLTAPSTIETSTVGVDPETIATGSVYTYRFPQRGTMPPVTLTWYDGGLRPATPQGIDPTNARQRLGDGGNGNLFVGDKGMLSCAGWGGMPRIISEARRKEYKAPEEKTIPRVKGHHADWLAACKGGTAASSNFEYAAKLTEIILLGNVALRSKKLIHWDGENMKATNAPEAEQLLRGEYRKGWEIA